jgi:hypothetical protein
LTLSYAPAAVGINEIIRSSLRRARSASHLAVAQRSAELRRGRHLDQSEGMVGVDPALLRAPQGGGIACSRRRNVIGSASQCGNVSAL